jgi:AbrB family looped-hinge helix DNA binding protein
MAKTSIKSDMGGVIEAKAQLNENGRIVIPATIRRRMELQPGETVLLRYENGTLRIESYRERIRRVQEEFKQFAKPGVLLSDELIAERREEARQEEEETRREMEEWLG